MFLRRPEFIKEWTAILKTGGFKYLVKEKGVSVLIAFVLFYLIRDSILYVILPYLSFRGIVSCY